MCTVTSLAVDATSIAAGLGSSGKVRGCAFVINPIFLIPSEPDVADF